MFCFAVWLLHFPLLSSVGKSRRQSPAAAAAAALRSFTPFLQAQNLGCISELLINPLCAEVGFDTTPSTRTFTRAEEFIARSRNSSLVQSQEALNHQWELQGWLPLEEAVPRPRAASGADLPFHISGDELLQSSLTAASAQASALHNWES